MRKRIYQIIQKASKGDKWSYAYDIFMLAIILASIIPLTVIGEKPYFTIIEIITTSVFIIDYILRWATADYKLNKGTLSFVLYPFTPMAIVDLISILPGFGVINQGFKIFRITRMLKILRIFKFLRYSDKISLFVRVLHKEKNVLLSVLGIAIFYVFLTALIMFNVEPHVNPISGTQTFSNFFDALYWATVTLTTVGYGDLCPVSSLISLI